MYKESVTNEDAVTSREAIGAKERDAISATLFLVLFGCIVLPLISLAIVAIHLLTTPAQITASPGPMNSFIVMLVIAISLLAMTIHGVYQYSKRIGSRRLAVIQSLVGAVTFYAFFSAVFLSPGY